MSTPLLSVDHLVKRYGDQTVVNDLSFHIDPGECLGIIGPNGAGKTTTLRMCLGLTEPGSGSVRSAQPANTLPCLKRRRCAYLIRPTSQPGPAWAFRPSRPSRR